MLLRALDRNEAAATAGRTLIGHPNLVVQGIGHIELAHTLLARAQITEGAREANAAVTALKAAEAGNALASMPMQVLQGEYFLRSGQTENGPTLTAAIKQARLAQGPDEWAQALFTLEAIAQGSSPGGRLGLRDDGGHRHAGTRSGVRGNALRGRPRCGTSR